MDAEAWSAHVANWREEHCGSPQELLEFYKSCPPHPCGNYAESMKVFEAMAVYLFRDGNVDEVGELLKHAETLAGISCSVGSACPDARRWPRIAQTIFNTLLSIDYTCSEEQLDLVWEWFAREPRAVCVLTCRVEGWAGICARIPSPMHMDAAIIHIMGDMLFLEDVQMATRLALDLRGAMPPEPSPWLMVVFHSTIRSLALYTASTPLGHHCLPVVVDEFISRLPSVYKTSRDAETGRNALEIYLADATSPNLALVAALSVFTKGAIHTQ